MAVPDVPERCAVTGHLLETYHYASRGRRYIAGMAGAIPLPLSAREITDWLEAHPSPLPRGIVDPVLFALDEVDRERDD